SSSERSFGRGDGQRSGVGAATQNSVRSPREAFRGLGKCVMVFAVQCPNPTCRKYQLVEDHDRSKVVHCLLCKTGIRIGGTAAPNAPASAPPASKVSPAPSRTPPPKPKTG